MADVQKVMETTAELQEQILTKRAKSADKNNMELICLLRHLQCFYVVKRHVVCADLSAVIHRGFPVRLA